MGTGVDMVLSSLSPVASTAVALADTFRFFCWAHSTRILLLCLPKTRCCGRILCRVGQRYSYSAIGVVGGQIASGFARGATAVHLDNDRSSQQFCTCYCFSLQQSCPSPPFLCIFAGSSTNFSALYRCHMKYNLSSAVLLLAVLFLCMGLFACSSGWSEEDEHFVQTYTDILIVRELTPDTTIANPKVQEIITKNGYTWESFRAQYMQYTAKAEQFRAMLDSARNRALRVVHEKKQEEENK